jgi:hypothetical protein
MNSFANFSSNTSIYFHENVVFVKAVVCPLGQVLLPWCMLPSSTCSQKHTYVLCLFVKVNSQSYNPYARRLTKHRKNKKPKFLDKSYTSLREICKAVHIIGCAVSCRMLFVVDGD